MVRSFGANIEALLNIYKLLSGKESLTTTKDINKLARDLLFVLPARKVDINEHQVFNELIEENIRTAA